MNPDPWTRSQSDVIDGMLQDVMETVHKYDGAASFAITVGVLEIAKQRVLEALRENVEDQEED